VPASRSALGRLAAFVVRRRRAVVLAWIAALAAAFGVTGLAGDWAADYNTPGSESKAAADLLAERFAARSPDTVDVVWQARGGATGAAATARVDRLLAGAAGLPGIGGGVRAADADVSRDGSIAVVRVPLTEPPGAVPVSTGTALLHLADRASGDGVRVRLGGNVVQNAQQGAISSEAVGLAIAAGVLVITFGSLVAAGLPLAAALFGLGISSALVREVLASSHGGHSTIADPSALLAHYIEATQNLSAEDRRKVFEGNARRVYPRLDAALTARGR